MKSNHWLIAAVIVLAIALAAESFYLFKIKKSDDDGKPYPVNTKAQNYAPGTSAQTRAGHRALRYADPWNDPLFQSPTASWDPFDEIDHMQQMMNRMFRDSLGRAAQRGVFERTLSYEPDLDVQETADSYLLRLDLPGIDKDKISLKIQNNTLTISGERKSEKEETAENGGVYRMERSFGQFMRTFTIPADAEADAMTAESKDGVLTIRLPKAKTAQVPAKTIQVK